MQTKLTLRLDAELIARAKRYGKRTGRSVSRMVADYFALLDQDIVGDDGEQMTPIVASLHGALSNLEIDAGELQREMLEEQL
ncbi:MAG TPA: DUF6364 family protein [Acidobacteriota bacterium]|jgi:hypothetical protein